MIPSCLLRLEVYCRLLWKGLADRDVAGMTGLSMRRVQTGRSHRCSRSGHRLHRNRRRGRWRRRWRRRGCRNDTRAGGVGRRRGNRRSSASGRSRAERRANRNRAGMAGHSVRRVQTRRLYRNRHLRRYCRRIPLWHRCGCSGLCHSGHRGAAGRRSCRGFDTRLDIVTCAKS